MYRTTDNAASDSVALRLPTKRCRSFRLHPSIFRNSSNSSTRRLQHVHPLLPSWNSAWPGWYTHPGLSPDPGESSLCDITLQPRRLQVIPGGIAESGSSESDSGAAVVVVPGSGWGARGMRGIGAEVNAVFFTKPGFGGEAPPSVTSGG